MRSLSIVLAVAVVGCGGSSSGDADAALVIDATPLVDAPVPDAAAPDASAPDAMVPDAVIPADAFIPTGGHAQYVIDTITIPTSSGQATACGLDIDSDPMARVDNALGQIVAALAGAAGADPQPGMDAALANGTALHLLDVQADSLADDPTVLLREFLGEDTDGNPADNFSGSEPFAIAADSPTDAQLAGAISGGQMDVGPGELSVRIVPFSGGTPIVLPLVGARIHGNLSGTELLGGILGGAVTSDTLDTVVIPALALNVQAVVATNCGGTFPNCCTAGTSGETLVSLFDTNDDCLVSEQEIRDSTLVQSLLAPDLDLFDATGAFNPLSDGVKDSLSIGVCFTAVGAFFTLP